VDLIALDTFALLLFTLLYFFNQVNGYAFIPPAIQRCC
jgi:hypothetical protein